MAVQVKFVPILPPIDVLTKDGQKILNALEKALKGDIGNQLENAMNKRIENWTHKPTIKREFSSLPTRFSLLVIPSGRGLKQWKIVSGGARPHFIFPKSIQKNHLFIHGGRGGYRSKTNVGNVYGRASSYSNNSYWAVVVHHPGVRPRNFEENVVKDEQASIERKLKSIVDGAVKI